MVRRTLQFVVTAVAVCAITANAQEPLASKTTQTLDQSVEAYQQGRLGEALRLAELALQSTSPEQIGMADRRLREDHQLDMSLVGLASFCRVELVLAGQGARLGRPPATELPAALEALDDRIALLLEPVRRELEVGMPAIIPDDVLTEKIDTIRPLVTQIDQVVLLQSHIQQLASRIRAADRAQLEERPRDIAGRKLPDEQKKLEQLRDRVTTRLVDFSLVRLNKSLNTIGDDGASFQNRFAATQKAGESLATLHTNWDRYKRAKHRTGGLDPNVEQRWRRQEELVHIQSGPLLRKVYHFAEGCNWWLRGRFGVGPLSGGLAKVVPSDMNEKSVLQALFNQPLGLPRLIPKPQDPLTTPAPYPIARRHLEIWQVENRSVSVTPPLVGSVPPPSGIYRYVAGLFGSRSFSGVSEWATDSKSDNVQLAQLVGYQEYYLALSHFEQLVALATPSELRALDDMIGQDNRFVIHSNLSSKYDNLDPASNLRLPPRPRDPRAARPHERRGLAWLMALARIEVGAMRAAFTGDANELGRSNEFTRRTGIAPNGPDGYGPFEDWPPTSFDRDAFLEVLFDGGRQHYYESMTEYRIAPVDANRRNPLAEPSIDPRFGPAGLRLIQLGRKLRIATEMLEAFRFNSHGSLTQTQQRELDRWINRIAFEEGRIHLILNPPESATSGPVVPARVDPRLPAPARAEAK